MKSDSVLPTLFYVLQKFVLNRGSHHKQEHTEIIEKLMEIPSIGNLVKERGATASCYRDQCLRVWISSFQDFRKDKCSLIVSPPYTEI